MPNDQESGLRPAAGAIGVRWKGHPRDAATKKLSQQLLPAAVQAAAHAALRIDTSATNRLRAVKFLAGVVTHKKIPKSAAQDARSALSGAAALLKQMSDSQKSPRIRSQAAKLTFEIMKMAQG